MAFERIDSGISYSEDVYNKIYEVHASAEQHGLTQIHYTNSDMNYTRWETPSTANLKRLVEPASAEPTSAEPTSAEPTSAEPASTEPAITEPAIANFLSGRDEVEMVLSAVSEYSCEFSDNEINDQSGADIIDDVPPSTQKSVQAQSWVDSVIGVTQHLKKCLILDCDGKVSDVDSADLMMHLGDLSELVNIFRGFVAGEDTKPEKKTTAEFMSPLYNSDIDLRDWNNNKAAKKAVDNVVSSLFSTAVISVTVKELEKRRIRTTTPTSEVQTEFKTESTMVQTEISDESKTTQTESTEIATESRMVQTEKNVGSWSTEVQVQTEINSQSRTVQTECTAVVSVHTKTIINKMNSQDTQTEVTESSKIDSEKAQNLVHAAAELGARNVELKRFLAESEENYASSESYAKIAEKKFQELSESQFEILCDINSIEKILKSKLKKKRFECMELKEKNDQIKKLFEEVYEELQQSINANIKLKRNIKEFEVQIQNSGTSKINKNVENEFNLKLSIEKENYLDLHILNKNTEDENAVLLQQSQFWQTNSTSLKSTLETLNTKFMKIEDEKKLFLTILTDHEEAKELNKIKRVNIFKEMMQLNEFVLSTQSRVRCICKIQGGKALTASPFTYHSFPQRDQKEILNNKLNAKIKGDKKHLASVEFRSNIYLFDGLVIEAKRSREENFGSELEPESESEDPGLLGIKSHSSKTFSSGEGGISRKLLDRVEAASVNTLIDEIRPQVRSVLNGSNVGVFSYGSASSAKRDPGLIFQTLDYLFSLFSDGNEKEKPPLCSESRDSTAHYSTDMRSSDSRVDFEACAEFSMFELHDDAVEDLLSGDNNSGICSPPSSRTSKKDENEIMKNCTSFSVQDAREAVNLMLHFSRSAEGCGRGSLNDSTKIPDGDPDEDWPVRRDDMSSDRLDNGQNDQHKHTDARVEVQSNKEWAALKRRLTRTNSAVVYVFKFKSNRECGSLFFVDLPTRQHVRATLATSQEMRESQRINKSLNGLSNVLHAIASESVFIPFRSSPLATSLQGLLGGDTRITLVANVNFDMQNDADNTETLSFSAQSNP